MSSPTQRSLALLRKRGYTACVVEKWIPQTCQRKDAFGFCDILAMRASKLGVLFVQATSRANLNARRAKLLACPEVGIALEAGNDVEIHGWSKKGPRGKRKLWHCDIVNIEAQSDGGFSCVSNGKQ